MGDQAHFNQSAIFSFSQLGPGLLYFVTLAGIINSRSRASLLAAVLEIQSRRVRANFNLQYLAVIISASVFRPSEAAATNFGFLREIHLRAVSNLHSEFRELP